MSPSLVIFAAYLVVMTIVGLVSSRQQRETSDYWVAGRRFGTTVMVLALMAAVMHGGSILSGVAFAGAFGGVAILPFMSFAVGFLIILVFFAKKLRDTGGFTLSDYMGERFASRGLRAFSAIVIGVSSVVYLIAQIRGMGLILEGLLGFSFNGAMIIRHRAFHLLCGARRDARGHLDEHHSVRVHVDRPDHHDACGVRRRWRVDHRA